MTVALPLLVAFVTFAAAVWLLDRREDRAAARRVSAYVDVPRISLPSPEEEVLRSRRERSLAATERCLRRLPGWVRYVRLVERADPRPSAVEIAWSVAGCSLLLVLVLAVAGASPVLVLGVPLAAALGTRVWLSRRVAARRRAFDEQLPELLFDVGSALRAGHGFNQALQAVAAEAPDPAGKEFRRVLAEARLGRPLEDALHDLGARIASRDLTFVVESIVVQRQVGGSLATVFGIVAESVRQRQQYALRVRALTAMGRLSAIVVLALPFGLALLLSAKNHAYLAPLFSPGVRLVTLLAGALVGVGALWLRRLVSQEGA